MRPVGTQPGVPGVGLGRHLECLQVRWQGATADGRPGVHIAVPLLVGGLPGDAGDLPDLGPGGPTLPLGDHALPHHVLRPALELQRGTQQIPGLGLRLDGHGVEYGVGELAEREREGASGLVAGERRWSSGVAEGEEGSAASGMASGYP